jgi:hypothetical protein
VRDLTPELTTDHHNSREVALFGHTPLSSAFRFVVPTWRNYIMYVDMEARAGDPDAARYLKVYNSLPPKERNAHFPEQLCDLSNVPHADLISWVTKQAWIEGSTRASLVLSFQRDEVLKSVAQYAMSSPDNLGHAKLFMSAASMLPQTGRQPGVQIFNTPVSLSSARSASDARSAGPRDSLPDMDDEIIELSQIMQTGSLEVAATQVKEGMDDDDED